MSSSWRPETLRALKVWLGLDRDALSGYAIDFTTVVCGLLATYSGTSDHTLIARIGRYDGKLYHFGSLKPTNMVARGVHLHTYRVVRKLVGVERSHVRL
jgi:hypothetical protein